MNNSQASTKFASVEEDLYQQYRTLSFGAVVCIGLGVLAIPTALAASFNPFLLLFPLVGVFFGTWCVMGLRNRQQEFTGYGLARVGWVLSILCFVGGTSYASFVYVTEVPDGYRRLKFSELQPDPQFPHAPVPPLAAEINEADVFVKGYVYPDEQLGGIKRFILVPDMGTCCFGGQPKLTDMMQVTLSDPDRIEYSMLKRSLTGKFRLGSAQAAKVGTVVYHLDEADVLR